MAARRVGAQVSLDPSFHFAKDALGNFSGILSELDFLFPNYEESVSMTGARDPAQAAESLLRQGVKTVALKLGADGCLVKTSEQELRMPSYCVPRVVDTTGAGDAFAGGFLAAVLKNCTLEEAACVGHAAAAMIVSEMGGYTAAPTVPRLRAFARERNDKRLLGALSRLRKRDQLLPPKT